MATKKPADQQPFVSESAAAAAPAPARSTRSNAVTHKHKKATPVAQPVDATPAPDAVEVKPTIAAAPSREEIATLAYLHWESRGYQGGSPEEDWLRAEHELVSR
jgi:Protein of unknown function (DUF2934)